MLSFVFFFCQEAYRILAPQPKVEAALPAFDGNVLTTVLPRKFQH